MSKYCPNWLSRTIHDQFGDTTTNTNLDNQSILRATRLTHYPHFSMLFWKMWDVFKVDTDVADYWLQLSYIPGEWWGWCRPWCHCSILAGVPSVWWDHWYSHRAAHQYLTTPARLISQSSNPLTLPPDYCTAAPTMQQLLTAAERYQSSVINISLFYVASKSKS